MRWTYYSQLRQDNAVKADISSNSFANEDDCAASRSANDLVNIQQTGGYRTPKNPLENRISCEHSSKIEYLLPRFALNKAKCSIVGGFLVIASLVNLQTMSNSGSYFISYMIEYSPGGELMNESNLLWIGSWYSLASGISSAIGGYIQFRYGSARSASFLGAFIYSISIISTKWTINYGYYYVLITFGILPGLGCGIAWTPAVINSFGWYPNNKGLAGGIIMSGLGVGAFFFTYITTLLVNPDNLPATGTRFVQPELLALVPDMFLKVGLTYLAMQIIGCCLLFKPPSESRLVQSESEPIFVARKLSAQYEKLKHHNPDEDEPDFEDEDDSELMVSHNLFESDRLLIDAQPESISATTTCQQRHQGSGYCTSFPWPRVISRQFFVLFVTMALSSQSAVFISSMQKQYGQTHIKDDHFLSVVGSLSSLAVSIGKICWGFSIDKISYVHCFTILTVIMFTTVLVLPFDFLLTNQYAFAICIWLASTSMIGFSVILNVKCYKIFGQRHATLLAGLVWTASIFNIPTSMLLEELFTYNRYGPCFLISALSLLSEIVLLSYVSYYKSRSWKISPS